MALAVGAQRAYQASLRRWAARKRRIIRLHRAGWSMALIGRRYGVTRQRIKAIVGKNK